MLPVFRRFAQQDYPTAPDWLGNFFNSLNVFAETTVTTLNKNLTIGQNVQGQKFTTSITSDGSGNLSSSLELKYTGGGQPNCCIIGNISRIDGTAITAPITVASWYLNLNTNPFTVVVDSFAGLDPSAKYNVTLLVL